MKAKALPLSVLAGALLRVGSYALTIDTVYIGDLGNPNDSTGRGSVSLGYAIGKYEVTLNQYTEFLNAVADLDSFGLYNPAMATDLTSAGISRSGLSGSYTYSVLGDGQRPVTYVSWFDAARFMNWLDNGQPNTGNQTAATTEQGAYTLNGATSGIILKNTGAQWWIPSENEWFKAAYYQPAAAGGDADGYWLYPTGSNEIPNSRNGSTSDPNSGNFLRNDGIANGFNGGYAVSNSPIYTISQNYLTPVGAFTQSDTYYGTFDQGGNVWELNDVVIGANRGARGGSYSDGETILRATHGSIDIPAFLDPTTEAPSVGFRVAAVPEPTAGVSMIVGISCLLARRRRPSAR